MVYVRFESLLRPTVMSRHEHQHARPGVSPANLDVAQPAVMPQRHAATPIGPVPAHSTMLGDPRPAGGRIRPRRVRLPRGRFCGRRMTTPATRQHPPDCGGGRRGAVSSLQIDRDRVPRAWKADPPPEMTGRLTRPAPFEDHGANLSGLRSTSEGRLRSVSVRNPAASTTGPSWFPG